MIRVYTANNSFPDWPAFANMRAAITYIENNSGEFENGETISLVDYGNCDCQFLVARFEMRFSIVEA